MQGAGDVGHALPLVKSHSEVMDSNTPACWARQGQTCAGVAQPVCAARAAVPPTRLWGCRQSSDSLQHVGKGVHGLARGLSVCGRCTISTLGGLAAASVPKPTVRVPHGERSRRSTLSRAEASSGKILMKEHVLSRRCAFRSRPWGHAFRESCRSHGSQDGVEYYRKDQCHWYRQRCTSV